MTETANPNEQLKKLANQVAGEEVEEENLIFAVKIFEPYPDGVKISKKNICLIEIVPDDGNLTFNF
jgi:hypothetical protein